MCGIRRCVCVGRDEAQLSHALHRPALRISVCLFVFALVCTVCFRVGRGPHIHRADLNRLWVSPSKAAHPEIFHIKEHLQHLHEGGAVRAA